MHHATSTNCECASSGFCKRHNRYKTRVAHKLCKESQDAFLTYEAQAGKIKEANLIEKAVNFVESVVEYVSIGQPKVSNEEYDKRLQICSECPLFTKKRSCTICGCNMDLKAKWKTSKCPDPSGDRWAR